MWAAARGVAAMDRGMRAGQWPRIEGMQLTGKTLGLVGFGGIAAEVARIASGSGMRVLAWNRTPKQAPNVEFVPLERLLAESHVVSLHLLLNDETRGFIGAEWLAQMRPGAMLVNTARGAVVDEAAMIDALRSGRLAHAALDVYDVEPLPPGHALAGLENVTLTSHGAFRTPEASENLIRRAIDIACQVSRRPDSLIEGACARLAELVDAADLKSDVRDRACRFESGGGHQLQCSKQNSLRSAI